MLDCAVRTDCLFGAARYDIHRKESPINNSAFLELTNKRGLKFIRSFFEAGDRRQTKNSLEIDSPWKTLLLVNGIESHIFDTSTLLFLLFVSEAHVVFKREDFQFSVCVRVAKGKFVA